MTRTLKALWNDEAGFIVSAELVLIATILVIGLIVGLSELQCSIVDEMNDVGEAIGSLNQSFRTSGVASFKHQGGIKARTVGSFFVDRRDSCDGNECALVCIVRPIPEQPKCGF